jgi:hypothetical protein
MMMNLDGWGRNRACVAVVVAAFGTISCSNGDLEAATLGLATDGIGGDTGRDSGDSADDRNDDDPSGGDGTSGGTPGSTSGSSSSGGDSGGESEGDSGDDGPTPDCVIDTECPLGQICENEVCVDGCSGMQQCPGDLTCCGGTCVDTDSDVEHCGECLHACDDAPNVSTTCDGAVCGFSDCDPGFFDCDGQGATGCESNVECSCTPGDEQPCYPGPPGTEGVGACTAGTQTCNAQGTAWSGCTGYVVPQPEVCNSGIDENCDTEIDNVLDIDGDGWTACDGDCCETIFQCSHPELVNPGAFEFVGNGVDDDCDPGTSDLVPAPLCSNAASFNGLTGTALAQAMDLCQFTTENEPLPTRKWGVIAADFRRPNDFSPAQGGHLSDNQNWQSAVLVNYGTGGIGPTHGSTMAGLSTGRMRDQNDPNYVNPNGGTNFGHVFQPPAQYLAANGGALPSSAGCSGNCPSGSGARDPIVLRLRIRVPTNALSFSYNLSFFSSEYWTYSCTQYNDFFLAMLDSAAPGLPADGNISFDALGNPLSVNNGFFDICQPKGCYNCPSGTGPLQGTGMQLNNTGGGTVWLQTSAPIVPGETINLYLMVFDVSDNILDSLVLLDNFLWNINPSDVGTIPQ